MRISTGRKVVGVKVVRWRDGEVVRDAAGRVERLLLGRVCEMRVLTKAERKQEQYEALMRAQEKGG